MKTSQTLTFCGVALGMLLTPPLIIGQPHFTTLYNVTNDSPIGLTAAHGAFYGATSGVEPIGGNGGTVFELRPPAVPGGPWRGTVLYSFTGTNGDGGTPLSAPAVGVNGALYGVTGGGGANFSGAVYEVRPPATPGGQWTESVIYSFPDVPTFPFGLIAGRDGDLYVGTQGGGTYGTGALLKLSPPAASGGSWTSATLYSFPPGPEGGPTGLTLGRDGVSYGTIDIGGKPPLYGGAVFALTPPASHGGTWTETVLHYFQSGRDGCTPITLQLADDGALYGATFGTIPIDGFEGPWGVGTVFQLIPPVSPGGTWTKAILRQFGKGNLHGPDSPLILRNGNIYGTTSTPKGGLVFEMRPPATTGGSWTTTILHAFTNGQTPGGQLVMDQDGAIYGVTQVPYSQPPQGTVYRIAPQ